MRTMYSQEKKENIILYYPTIKIKDGVWLRNALLYWDKVSSIVPSVNYSDENSAEVEYLQNAGLYEPVYPVEMQKDEDICKEFCKNVKKNIERHRDYSKSYYSREYFMMHVDKMRIPNVDMVHIDKMPRSILDYLLDEGIAKSNCDGPWINMNERDANIYMATLARYLAKIHGNIEIGTDNSRKFLYPFISEKSKNKLDKQIYLNVAMQEILPTPNLNSPLEDIIDFKNQYKSELKCFRNRIDQFHEGLEVCKNIKELEKKIQIFQIEIKRYLEEIDNLMKESGIRKTKRALRILVPIGLETGIAMLGLEGIISPAQTIIANAAAGLGAKLFCEEKESQISADKAYLFYARKNGIIMPHGSRLV
ncbi:MAG: DUF6236 family protein [Bacteroides fragilis]|nr:DUF6236 family protein [Bacteroides fragilis]